MNESCPVNATCLLRHDIQVETLAPPEHRHTSPDTDLLLGEHPV